jgi:S1-C subfamily serine protease
VHPRLLRELELRGGVEVTFVETASPAWEGGVREGDVLLVVNRDTVNDVDAYRKAITRLPGGTAVSALLSREGGLLFVALRTK